MRWVAAEIRERVQELLGCRLGACVGGSYLEILLNECCGGGGGFGLSVRDEAKPQDVTDDDDDSADGQCWTSETSFAQTDTHQPECVDQSNDEGESIGSGDGREPCQEWVVYLGNAEKIPRQTCDARTRQLNSDPCERDQQESGLTAKANAECSDQSSKQGVVET